VFVGGGAKTPSGHKNRTLLLASYYIIKDNNSVERAMLSSVFCDESKGRGAEQMEV